jgi:hypothetical protein
MNDKQAKREIKRRIKKIEVIENKMFEEKGYGFTMNSPHELMLRRLNCALKDIGYASKGPGSTTRERLKCVYADRLATPEYGSEL